MDNDGQWSQPYPFTITIREVRRVFYVKDHLGNIRQTIDQSGSIKAAQDYYPYGETLRGYNSGLSNEKYKYNGKERDIETDYDYSISRYSDNKLGMWLQVDPLTEKYPGVSPYNFCLNNPLIYLDPDGKNPIWGLLKGFLKSTIKGETKKWIKNFAKELGEEVGDDLIDELFDREATGWGNEKEDLDRDGSPDNQDEIDNREDLIDKYGNEREKETWEGSDPEKNKEQDKLKPREKSEKRDATNTKTPQYNERKIILPNGESIIIKEEVK